MGNGAVRFATRGILPLPCHAEPGDSASEESREALAAAEGMLKAGKQKLSELASRVG